MRERERTCRDRGRESSKARQRQSEMAEPGGPPPGEPAEPPMAPPTFEADGLAVPEYGGAEGLAGDISPGR